MKRDTDVYGLTVRFSLVTIVFVIFFWCTYALAVAGFFTHAVIRTLFIFGSIGATAAMARWFAKETVTARILFVLVIGYVAFLLSGTAPSVFSGRDQGSIAEAAIELANTGHLSFSVPASESFFPLYGTGKALNFPGFFYDRNGSLHSQFPVSYISLVAAFYTVFGLSALVAVNGVLLALSFLTIFILVRWLTDETYAAGSALLAVASFLPGWFARFTLTENLGLFLFLSLSLSVTLFLKSPRRSDLVSSIAIGILFAVTRVEGLAILAIASGLLFLSETGKTFAFSRSGSVRRSIFVGTMLVLACDFFINITRYTSIAKAVFRTDSTISDMPPLASGLAGRFADTVSFWNLLLPYGLFFPIALGLVGVVVLIVRKRLLATVPALLALPTFLYLVDPNISADHPWMLRRLSFSVWPALLVSFSAAVYAITSDKGITAKKIALSAMGIVALTGIVPTVSTFRFFENPDLLGETRRLADSVGPDDLILVDRSATGDPYAIPAGPLRFLYGRNAVYFFNPDDFAKIPKDRYDHVYLLAPIDGFDAWSDLPASFTLMSVFSFRTERLGPLPLVDHRFPDRTVVTTDSLLFSLDPL